MHGSGKVAWYCPQKPVGVTAGKAFAGFGLEDEPRVDEAAQETTIGHRRNSASPSKRVKLKLTSPRLNCMLKGLKGQWLEPILRDVRYID